jgi:hypothetical protein
MTIDSDKHCLAFCHALKVDTFLIYAVVYFVYFFPWREVKALRLRAAHKPAAGGAEYDVRRASPRTATEGLRMKRRYQAHHYRPSG